MPQPVCLYPLGYGLINRIYIQLDQVTRCNEVGCESLATTISELYVHQLLILKNGTVLSVLRR